MALPLDKFRRQAAEARLQAEAFRTQNEAFQFSNEEAFQSMRKRFEEINERQQQLDERVRSIEQLEAVLKSFHIGEGVQANPYDRRRASLADREWVEVSKAISSSLFRSEVTLSHENHIFFDPDRKKESTDIGKRLSSRRIEISKSAYSLIGDLLTVVQNCFADSKNLSYFLDEKDVKNAIREIFFKSNPIDDELLINFKKAVTGSDQLILWISDDETRYDFQLNMSVRMSSVQKGSCVTMGLISVVIATYKVLVIARRLGIIRIGGLI